MRLTGPSAPHLLVLLLLLLGAGVGQSRRQDPYYQDDEGDEEGSGYEDEYDDEEEGEDGPGGLSTPVMPTRVVPALRSPLPGGGEEEAGRGRTRAPGGPGESVYVREQNIHRSYLSIYVLNKCNVILLFSLCEIFPFPFDPFSIGSHSRYIPLENLLPPCVQMCRFGKFMGPKTGSLGVLFRSFSTKCTRLKCIRP